MLQIKATADCLSPATSESAIRIWWRSHGYIFPSFILSMLVWCWFVTWGDWKFFEHEDFCGFYDAYARSMLHGHFDVPREAIGVEAFTFEGKTYGYFGVGPAFLRIPLLLIFPNMDGKWSRVMMLIAATVGLICAYALLRRFQGNSPVLTRSQRVLHSIFIITAGIGASTVFLIGRSYTYHEALMWSGAFALLFTLIMIRYFARPHLRFLLFAGVFSFMSFHCRGTAGAGTVVAMSVVAAVLVLRAITKSEFAGRILGLAKVVNPAQHALIAAMAVAVTLGVYCGVNYAKFRTFDALPLRYYDFYQQFPVRLRITEGKQIHLQNVPTAVATYFGIHGFRIRKDFPWFYLEEEETVVGWPRNDVIEPFSTVPVSMPALVFLATVGIGAIGSVADEKLKRARLPALTLFLGGSIVLATVGVTERYLHDFYPALIICAAAGVTRLATNRHLKTLNLLVAVLAFISIALNCSFSFTRQREDLGAPPEKVQEYEGLQQRVNSVTERLFGRD